MKDFLAHLQDRLALLDESRLVMQRYADTAVAVHDADGNILLANKQFVALVGREKRGILGLSLYEVLALPSCSTVQEPVVVMEQSLVYNGYTQAAVKPGQYTLLATATGKQWVRYESHPLRHSDSLSLTLALIEPVV